ncbi:MAG: aminotransferase class V-fold PLP-dependent enzyme [Deltaproteobacteria bacterium]|nr:aminotransferase class V-fold PLP-dependent enzyme [Deltaproteobacteria bacterium]
MPPRSVYLDHAASAPVTPEARAALLQTLDQNAANPSSLHAPGVAAARILERARDALRAVTGSRFRRAVLVSGGTEANNLAVLGLGRGGRKRRVAATAIEHASVLSALDHLREQGVEVALVPPGPAGEIDLDRLLAAARGAALLAVHLVHNELGTVVDVAALSGELTRVSPETVLHVDAVQALGRLDLPAALGESASVALSGHKVGAPQGVGALLLAGEAHPRPLLFGGEQQDGLRAGTENVPGAAAFGVAARQAAAERATSVERLARLDRRLRAGLEDLGDSLRPFVPPGRAVPGLLALALRGLPPEVMLHKLERRGVFASAGSACHARHARSPLLDALGTPRDVGLIRVSMGRGTTEEDVDAFLEAAHDALRESMP